VCGFCLFLWCESVWAKACVPVVLPCSLLPCSLLPLCGTNCRGCVCSGNTTETKGTAFVVYEDIYDAKNAVDHLSGFNIGGRYLIALYYQVRCRTSCRWLYCCRLAAATVVRGRVVSATVDVSWRRAVL
jgi:hypothetical protein